MASKRSQRIHGKNGFAKPEGDVQGRTKAATEKKRIEVDRSPEGDAERARMCFDPLYLYDNYTAQSKRNPVTGEVEKLKLDTFQFFMIDFLLLDIIKEIKSHSPLADYLPEMDEHGRYPEIWLYWKTLDGEPQIQDGSGRDADGNFIPGSIAQMFYEKFWQGLVVRVCGDAKTKCLLAPRNHLKTTCGCLEKQFRIIRNPEHAHLIRTGRQKLAKQFMNGIKMHWDANENFRRYYGDLVPEKRESEWTTEAIQLNIPVEMRSNDPTLATCGNASEATGTHWRTGTLDDVVGEKNSTTAEQLEKTREMVGAVNAQRNADGILHNQGTRWHEDDAHGLFVGQPGANEWSGSLSHYSCFMVATALDADESVAVEPLPVTGLSLTPLNYGKPIWHGFPLKALQQVRASMTEYRYFGQYMNQLGAASQRLFDPTWITRIGDVPEFSKYDGLGPMQLAFALKLNIFVAFDTARGGSNQTGRVDRTAGFVLGQTRDKKYGFFLGGFCEKLQKQYIPKGMVDLCLAWRDNTQQYSGIFRAGFEAHAYTKWIRPMLEAEQHKQGTGASFPIEELEHGNNPKDSELRIGVLVQPYSERRIIWPSLPNVKAVHPGHAAYDIVAMLKSEFVGYSPQAMVDDLIDAHAYAWAMALPTEWRPTPDVKKVVVVPPGNYTRVTTDDAPVHAMSYQDIAQAEMEMRYE